MTEWTDGKCRCKWANPKNPAYVAYHDNRWGIPEYDDRELFKMLILESFQAGLSWECVLNKEKAFDEAFDFFDLNKVCEYDEAKKEALSRNAGIIRNRLKISAAVNNANIFKGIQREYGSFCEYIWGWSDHKIIYEYDKTTSDLSDRISKDLKKRGMKFVGSVIIYSYLQAIGIINSHVPDCYLYTK